MRILVLLCLLTLSVWADPGEDELKEGNKLLDQRQFAQALARYQEGLKLAPDSPELLYQGGIAAYEAGQGPAAIGLWKHLSELEPTNWRAMARLVQAYQLTGNLAARDAQRQALYDLRTRDKALARETDYCRDQYQVGDRTIVVFEKYALQGAKGVRYLFVISRQGKKEPNSITLGSYDAVTRVARETGEIGPDQRIYHLDFHEPGKQATYLRFVNEPEYDVLRKSVLGILDGSLKPLTTTETR